VLESRADIRLSYSFRSVETPVGGMI